MSGQVGGGGGGVVDVAEACELIHEEFFFGGADGGDGLVRGDGADVVPRGDAADGILVFEGGDHDLAVHVVGDGEAAEVEDGGGDVEDGGSGDGFVRDDAGAGHDEDAEGAVPLGHGGGLIGAGAGAEVTAFEAVVGDEDDGGVRACEVEHACEHGVVEAAGGGDDVSVGGGVSRGDAREEGRVERHEVVCEFVEGAEVDAEEVPWFVFEDVGGGGLEGGGGGEDEGDLLEAGAGELVGLVERGGGGDEGEELIAFDFGWVDAEGGEGGGAVGRVDGAVGDGPWGGEGCGGEGEAVAEAEPVDGFSWVAGEPSDGV